MDSRECVTMIISIAVNIRVTGAWRCKEVS